MLTALLKYETDKVKHGKKLIVPVIILAAFLYFNYSVSNLEVLPSFSTTSMMLFAIMVMFGVMYNDIDYSMIESAMLVSMKNRRNLYIGRILMIGCIGILASFISIVYPMILSISGTAFNRKIGPADIVSGIILCSVCSITGGVFGLIANKRIFHKKEIIIGISFLFVICTAAKKAMMTGFFMRIIYAFFPPVFDLGQIFSQDEHINIMALLPYLLWGIFYILIESVIYVISMNKLKN